MHKFAAPSKQLPGAFQTPRPMPADAEIRNMEKHYNETNLPRMVKNDESNLLNHVNGDLFNLVMKEVEQQGRAFKPGTNPNQKRIALESSYAAKRYSHQINKIKPEHRFEFMKSFVMAKISQKLAMKKNVDYSKASQYLTFNEFKGLVSRPLQMSTPAARQLTEAATPLGHFGATPKRVRSITPVETLVGSPIRIPPAQTPAGSPERLPLIQTPAGSPPQTPKVSPEVVTPSKSSRRRWRK